MDKELLSLLACPKCRGDLTSLFAAEGDADPNGLSCPVCALVYPVTDNIPVLLIEDAVPASSWSPAGKQPRP